MPYYNYIQKKFYKYCIDNNLKIKDVIGRLKASRTFIYNVLDYRAPCPEWLADELSKIIGERKDVIELFFGKLPTWIIELLQKRPDIVYNKIVEAKKLIDDIEKKNPDSFKIKRHGYKSPRSKILL